MSRIAPSYRETCVPPLEAAGSAKAATRLHPAAVFISGSGMRICVGQTATRILKGSTMKRVLLAGAIGSFLFLGASFLNPDPVSAWPAGLPQEAKYRESDGDPEGPDLTYPGTGDVEREVGDSEATSELELLAEGLIAVLINLVSH